MNAFLPLQPGKENQRLQSKSNKRKIPKSPIKIRQKIKQLQEMHRQTKRVSLSKEKQGQRDLAIQSINKGERGMIGQDGRLPFQHLQKEKQPFRSSDKKISNPVQPPNAHKMENKARGRQQSNPKIAQNHLFLSQKDIRTVEQRPPTRVISNQDGVITHLKEENIRYKKIYSSSLQKLQRLEEMLRSIKLQNQAEKNMLEGTVGTLQKKIQERRCNITHIYSYKHGNMLMVNETIIAETDNENSSSIVDTFSRRIHKASSLSYLSIESK